MFESTARRICAGAIVSGALLIAVPPVAVGAGACDTGAFCAYVATNFNPAYAHYEWQNDYAVWGSAVGNKENSVKNNGTTGKMVRVYDQSYYIDSHYCFLMGHSLNLPDNKDNDGESHKWLTPTSSDNANCL